MTVSKKNQPSEESVGNVPYYRTSSPLEVKNEQTRLSIKHTMPALHIQDPSRALACPIVVHDDNGQPLSRKELDVILATDPNDFDGDQLQYKIIKDRKMEKFDLHPSTPAAIKEILENNHRNVARTDTEYRLQHVLDKEGIGTKHTPMLDHGNSHNREMLPGSKITDCYGTKGVVVRVLDDTEMPKVTGAESEYAEYDLHAIAKKLVSSEVWRELRFVINQLADVFGKETLLEMAQNKHAPAVDVYSYINNTVDAAGAMYIERAIGEQYGLKILNKAKEAKASRIGVIKAARSAD